MTEGCCRATIPCGTDGLEPCSICCGGLSRPNDASGLATGSPMSSSGSPAAPASEAEHDAPLAAEDSSLDWLRAFSLGATDGNRGAMPEAPSDDEVTEYIMTREIPTPTRRSSPADSIRGAEAFLGNGCDREALGMLADVAADRPVQRGRGLERAISSGVAMAEGLLRMAKDEPDAERRDAILRTMGHLANSGVLKATLQSISAFPANWSSGHSLAIACNQHDMFYMVGSLTDTSEVRHMGISDFEDGVLPMLRTVDMLAQSRFQQFPRAVVATKRFPDGPGTGRAWGTKESVLILPEDVDDPHVRALMDKDSRLGKAKFELFERGVPGYWELGVDPDRERAEYAERVEWMAAHAGRWGRRRARQAMREFDENTMPILRWLAKEGTAERLRSRPPVEALDLL